MMFPILGTTESIPWVMIFSHDNQAMINHGQTLLQLKKRGGLDWTEALAVLEDRDYKRMDMQTAKIKVLELVTDFKNKLGGI